MYLYLENTFTKTCAVYNSIVYKMYISIVHVGAKGKSWKSRRYQGTTAHRVTAIYYRSIGNKELVMKECRFWMWLDKAYRGIPFFTFYMRSIMSQLFCAKFHGSTHRFPRFSFFNHFFLSLIFLLFAPFASVIACQILIKQWRK